MSSRDGVTTELKPVALERGWAEALVVYEELDEPSKAVMGKTMSRMLKQYESWLATERKRNAQALSGSGWSTADIANLQGVSRARAGQLIKED